MNAAIDTPLPPQLVYLVDDEEAVTRGMAFLLDSVGIRSQAFQSAAAFLRESAATEAIACLVTDLRMPEMGGLDLLEEMRRRGHELPALVLSAHGDVPVAVKAMQLGALDFIQKPFNPESFLGGVNKALRIAREGYAKRRARQDAEDRLKALTAREREVFAYLLEGASSKLIARRLDISPKTVDVHRANVMSKLQVESLGELLKGFRLLLPPDDAPSAS